MRRAVPGSCTMASMNEVSTPKTSGSPNMPSGPTRPTSACVPPSSVVSSEIMPASGK